MTDSFGRVIDYLRLSLTDRCPMRCIYCIPKEGTSWIPHKEILSFEEFQRLISIMAGLGIKKIKITGGEPLARRGIVPFIASLSRIPGIEKISLTSNALFLDKYLTSLLKTGLCAINISLDSMNRETYRSITSLDAFRKVQKNLYRLLETRLPLKINCVPLKNINERDIIPLARLARENRVAVRFIELMPLGAAFHFQAIPAPVIFSMLEREFGTLYPCDKKLGEGPAKYYKPEGFIGDIGFISPLSDQFCKSCNRLRLSSQGLLFSCLASDMNTNLKVLLRGGKSDGEIASEIQSLVRSKPAAHNFIVEKALKRENHKNMNEIGG
ncbi:MAG: GTP 3',8-cyclase MoaA [Spirochaetaceae bacterium]|jgi:cyclic pyranopterin phosphate synthase|nr:GTP 3',8-cyclase MoaA [Spirochaetaceae bacterium]